MSPSLIQRLLKKGGVDSMKSYFEEERKLPRQFLYLDSLAVQSLLSSYQPEPETIQQIRAESTDWDTNLSLGISPGPIGGPGISGTIGRKSNLSLQTEMSSKATDQYRFNVLLKILDKEGLLLDLDEIQHNLSILTSEGDSDASMKIDYSNIDDIALKKEFIRFRGKLDMDPTHKSAVTIRPYKDDIKWNLLSQLASPTSDSLEESIQEVKNQVDNVNSIRSLINQLEEGIVEVIASFPIPFLLPMSIPLKKSNLWTEKNDLINHSTCDIIGRPVDIVTEKSHIDEMDKKINEFGISGKSLANLCFEFEEDGGYKFKENNELLTGEIGAEVKKTMTEYYSEENPEGYASMISALDKIEISSEYYKELVSKYRKQVKNEGGNIPTTEQHYMIFEPIAIAW